MKKILSINEAINEIISFRNDCKKIVLVGGCFDILHPGHLQFLEKANKEGDILIVALESDRKVHELKGEGRPVNSQIKRAEALAKLSSVDIVLLLPYLKDNKDYFQLVKDIKPDIIAVTSLDPKMKLKEKQAKAVGGKLKIVTQRLKEYSTSKIINKELKAQNSHVNSSEFTVQAKCKTKT